MTTVFDPSLYSEKVPVERKRVTRLKRPAKVKVSSPIELPEFVEIPDVKGIVFDPKLYKKVLAQPEGMRHRVYRKMLARYVTTLSGFERVDVLKQREEIEEAEEEWKSLNFEVLRRLGFSEGEAGMLRDMRLDSPGMRTLIRKRAEDVKKRLRAEAALRRVG